MEKELIHKSMIECVKFTLFNNEGKNRCCADRLREEFLVEFNNKISHYLLDISHIKSINSSFLGVIGFMKQSIGKDGYIIIIGVTEEARAILDISGLTKAPNVEISLNKEELIKKEEVEKCF